MLAAGPCPELRVVSAVSVPAAVRTVQGTCQVSIFWQRQLPLPVPSLTGGNKSERCFKYSSSEINTFSCFPFFYLCTFMGFLRSFKDDCAVQREK